MKKSVNFILGFAMLSSMASAANTTHGISATVSTQTIDMPSPNIKFALYNGSGVNGTQGGTSMTIDLGKEIVMVDLASLGYKNTAPSTEPGIGDFKDTARAFIMVYDANSVASFTQFKIATSSPHVMTGVANSSLTMGSVMLVPFQPSALSIQNVSPNGTMNTAVIPQLEAVSGDKYQELAANGESSTINIIGGTPTDKAVYIPIGFSASDSGGQMTIPGFANKYKGDSYTGSLSFTVEATYS
ncbi:hypothetical protein [Cysteiniphilum sp. JM-1]|uniref:hypothetical protein n=1 Tax=Cysteiniphilum sp. JM-1 TaxID=2610891 RepID=UPI001247CAE5|nr:hypothetical protein [Cysteiniphilum sp. JM-1]